MRYCLILLLILTSSKLFATQYDWQFTHFNSESVQPAAINMVSCLDDSNSVVCRTIFSYPYSRWIEHTTDYGLTWDTLFYEDLNCKSWEVYQYLISDIKYLDKNNIIAAYGYRNFLQSTDGGKSWIDTSYFDNSFAYNEISSFDSLVFVAGATDQYMGVSNDLGKTWKMTEVNLNLDNNREYIDTTIYAPQMYNDTLFTFVHLKHRVPFNSQLTYFLDNIFMFSTDHGKNWQKLFTIEDLALSNSYAIDDNYFYTQTVDYSFDTVLVYKPDGTGIDTTLSPTPHWQMVKVAKHSGDIDVITDSLSFTSGTIIEMNKFDNYLNIATLFRSYYSSDFGDTWIEEEWNSSNTSAGMINDYERLSMSKGFMVGNAKFATLQPTTSVTEQNRTLQYLHLYPNPAAPGSKINLEFDATEAGEYSFRLSSMDGRNIDLMQNDFFSQGRVSKSIELNSNLTAGTYVLSVYNNDKLLASKRFVIEK